MFVAHFSLSVSLSLSPSSFLPSFLSYATFRNDTSEMWIIMHWHKFLFENILSDTSLGPNLITSLPDDLNSLVSSYSIWVYVNFLTIVSLKKSFYSLHRIYKGYVASTLISEFLLAVNVFYNVSPLYLSSLTHWFIFCSLFILLLLK